MDWWNVAQPPEGVTAPSAVVGTLGFRCRRESDGHQGDADVHDAAALNDNITLLAVMSLRVDRL